MVKILKNIEQVNEVRAENEGLIFNKAAALMALKSTPKANVLYLVAIWVKSLITS